jgi:hypothetical protein
MFLSIHNSDGNVSFFSEVFFLFFNWVTAQAGGLVDLLGSLFHI